MREFKRGDVVRLNGHYVSETARGARRLQAGWEFEVISAGGGDVKAWDRNGVKVLLPVYAVELVRSAHSPDDDTSPPVDDGDHPGGGPVGVAKSKLPKRRGLVRVAEAA
jgi:hypothetical protein